MLLSVQSLIRGSISDLTNCEITTWAEIKSWMLNWLSHSGALRNFLHTLGRHYKFLLSFVATIFTLFIVFCGLDVFHFNIVRFIDIFPSSWCSLSHGYKRFLCQWRLRCHNKETPKCCALKNRYIYSLTKQSRRLLRWLCWTETFRDPGSCHLVSLPSPWAYHHGYNQSWIAAIFKFQPAGKGRRAWWRHTNVKFQSCNWQSAFLLISHCKKLISLWDLSAMWLLWKNRRVDLVSKE